MWKCNLVTITQTPGLRKGSDDTRTEERFWWNQDWGKALTTSEQRKGSDDIRTEERLCLSSCYHDKEQFMFTCTICQTNIYINLQYSLSVMKASELVINIHYITLPHLIQETNRQKMAKQPILCLWYHPIVSCVSHIIIAAYVASLPAFTCSSWHNMKSGKAPTGCIFNMGVQTKEFIIFITTQIICCIVSNQLLVPFSRAHIAHLQVFM